MKVVSGLRVGDNKTNMRSEALTRALSGAGHTLNTIGREEHVRAGTDLYVQTGFAASGALLSAIDQGIPYIIMEAPVFRSFDLNTHSSWGYNGLQGGAWRPTPPEGERPKPELKDPHDGPTLIIGQKPTDHSLRGSDHVEWIRRVRTEIPEADFRPHPLMVLEGTLEPIEEVLERYGRVITYSSTVGVDSVVAGCETRADCRQSLVHLLEGGNRDSFTHALSWMQAAHRSYKELWPYIESGYEEARDRAQRGLVEIPRGKYDGRAVTERYNNERLCRATPQRT